MCFCGKTAVFSVPEYEWEVVTMVDNSAKEYTVKLRDPGYVRKSRFNNNEVKTAKYTLLTFIPFCTFYQFKRLANLYFLITAVVQSIPQITPLDPFTAIGPLILVLVIAMIKEGYEDFKRRGNDKAVNNSVARVWRDGGWTDVLWKEVRLGDVLKVLDGETFPADLILLSTSETDGCCKLQTANLDGERTLKTRQALLFTMALFEGDTPAFDVDMTFTVDPPDDKLEKFDGYITDSEGLRHSLSPKQLVLRVIAT